MTCRALKTPATGDYSRASFASGERGSKVARATGQSAPGARVVGARGAPRSPWDRVREYLHPKWGHPVCESFAQSSAGAGSRRPQYTRDASWEQLAVTFGIVVSMRRRREDEDGGQDIAELAALADGSLAPERRAALEARVAASSELADRLAEQAAGSHTRPERRGRSRCADGSAGAHRGATTYASRGGAGPPRPHRRLGNRSAGGRHRAGRVPLGYVQPAFPYDPRRDRPAARRPGPGDADQDNLGLANRTRCHRTSPSREWAVLRGVAA